MSQVIQLTPPLEPDVRAGQANLPVIRTDAIHVVFTSLDDTIVAVRVAAKMAKAMGVPVTLIHFRAVPYSLSVQTPVGVSPIETDDFIERLRAEGIDVRVRVYLCRNERRAIPMAFKRRSIVVIGGRHRRWPTPEDRLRHDLEAAGHYVVFVDARDHKETSRA